MAIAYGDPVLLNLGLLLIRVIFGLTMVAHGAQKLFGWFGGYGLAGTGGFFEQLGFRPGQTFAAAAAFSEFVGGWLFALGLFRPRRTGAHSRGDARRIHKRTSSQRIFRHRERSRVAAPNRDRSRRGSAYRVRYLLARRRAGARRNLDAGTHWTGASGRRDRGHRQSSAQKKSRRHPTSDFLAHADVMRSIVRLGTKVAFIVQA